MSLSVLKQQADAGPRTPTHNQTLQPVMKLCSKYDLQFVKKKIWASIFFMRNIFNMSVTYLQSVEKIQWKL